MIPWLHKFYRNEDGFPADIANTVALADKFPQVYLQELAFYSLINFNIKLIIVNYN